MKTFLYLCKRKSTNPLSQIRAFSRLANYDLACARFTKIVERLNTTIKEIAMPMLYMARLSGLIDGIPKKPAAPRNGLPPNLRVAEKPSNTGKNTNGAFAMVLITHYSLIRALNIP